MQEAEILILSMREVLSYSFSLSSHLFKDFLHLQLIVFTQLLPNLNHCWLEVIIDVSYAWFFQWDLFSSWLWLLDFTFFFLWWLLFLCYSFLLFSFSFLFFFLLDPSFLRFLKFSLVKLVIQPLSDGILC